MRIFLVNDSTAAIATKRIVKNLKSALEDAAFILVDHDAPEYDLYLKIIFRDLDLDIAPEDDAVVFFTQAPRSEKMARSIARFLGLRLLTRSRVSRLATPSEFAPSPVPVILVRPFNGSAKRNQAHIKDPAQVIQAIVEGLINA